MAPNSGMNTPNVIPGLSVSFQNRQRDMEMSDLYFKPTRSLVATPFSNTDSDPMGSSLDTSLKSSPNQERRELFRSESTLVSRIETQPIRERIESPESTSNWFSRLIFYWVSSLLWVSRPLSQFKSSRVCR